MVLPLSNPERQEDNVDATTDGQAAPLQADQINWGHPRVPWNFNLRLTEPYQNKLEFILANRREKSMHKMLAKVIEDFVEAELSKLHLAGIFPDQNRR